MKFQNVSQEKIKRLQNIFLKEVIKGQVEVPKMEQFKEVTICHYTT
jgi:hypothetical protein